MNFKVSCGETVANVICHLSTSLSNTRAHFCLEASLAYPQTENEQLPALSPDKAS